MKTMYLKFKNRVKDIFTEDPEEIKEKRWKKTFVKPQMNLTKGKGVNLKWGNIDY